MKDVGIYVHIPFCKQKCYYCDFNSFADKNEFKEEYMKWLLYEIEHVGEGNKEDYEQNRDDLVRVHTIYIGGGTPSILDSKFIKKIMETIRENFYVIEDAEVTIEVNPGTVDEQKLQDYIDCGINRVSIGLQETDDALLKSIGRIHTYEQFLITYEKARKVGFENINVDLIIGLPNQNIKNVKSSISQIIELNPEHISVYSLIVEEGTRLNEMIEDKSVLPIDDKEEREMYWYVKNKLEKNGYHHYEISNYAKPGFESKHNTDCWNQKDYIGFGAGAHSYTNAARFSNVDSIEEYISNYQKGEEEKNFVFHERQTLESAMKEFMMLGLRKIDGVTISDFKNKFVQNPVYIFKDELQKLINEDLIEIDENYIRLNKNGMDFANLVWEEFV